MLAKQWYIQSVDIGEAKKRVASELEDVRQKLGSEEKKDENSWKARRGDSKADAACRGINACGIIFRENRIY